VDREFQLKNYKPTPFKLPTSKYKQEFADLAVYFISTLRHTKGRWYGHSFELIHWQERIIRDLFGVVSKYDECRQFRTAYIEIPKKQGKSELAAAVALLLTCTDLERGGEIYGCASDRQQASIVFDVAVSMLDQCPELKKFIRMNMAQKRITFRPLDSFYQVLSAEAYTKHGFNPHGVIFDELHSLPDRKLFDVMIRGSGDAREQPLTFIITTAGVDRNSICFEVHQKAMDVLEGRKNDPRFYPVIYGASDDDDWTDPEVWRKSNPSLGVTVKFESMQEAFQDAKDNPIIENNFRQLRLNQWVKQTFRAINMERWDECAYKFDMDQLKKRPCYAGLDLSTTTDITAFVLVFPPEYKEDKYIILPFFWIPEESLETRVRRDHVRYDQWWAEGFINTTKGDVIHYSFVEKTIVDLGKKYNIKEIAYDRWGSEYLIQNLTDAGFKVVRFGQGFKEMSPASKEFFQAIMEKRLAHAGNPVLRWMADNLRVDTDAAGNVKPDKEKATEKIDGIVATIMGLGRAALNEEKPKKPGKIMVYSEDGWL